MLDPIPKYKEGDLLTWFSLHTTNPHERTTVALIVEVLPIVQHQFHARTVCYRVLVGEEIRVYSEDVLSSKKTREEYYR